MLNRDDALLLIVDVQGKLASLVHDNDVLQKNISKLIRACRILQVPVLYAEQYPKGLGPTVTPLKDLLAEESPFEKLSFSCCGAEGFMDYLRKLNRNEVLVTGIETHVCVYQTAVELIEYGYNVHLIVDAVSSRTPENRDIGVHCIENAGAWLKSTEMVIFELLKIAEGEDFKAISGIIKE
jgi:nicotinamidase-related amidase